MLSKEWHQTATRPVSIQHRCVDLAVVRCDRAICVFGVACGWIPIIQRITCVCIYDEVGSGARRATDFIKRIVCVFDYVGYQICSGFCGFDDDAAAGVGYVEGEASRYFAKDFSRANIVSCSQKSSKILFVENRKREIRLRRRALAESYFEVRLF